MDASPQPQGMCVRFMFVDDKGPLHACGDRRHTVLHTVTARAHLVWRELASCGEGRRLCTWQEKVCRGGTGGKQQSHR